MMPPAPSAPRRPDTGVERARSEHDVPWRWWHAIAVYLASSLVLGFVAVLIVGGEVTDGTGLSLRGVVANIALGVASGAVLIVWLRWRTRQWREAVRLPDGSHRLRTFAAGLVAGIVLAVVVLFGVGTLLVIVFRALTGDTVSAPDQLSPQLSVGAQVLATVLAVGVAPIVEELFFRGILFRSLRRYGLWIAAIVSSVIFGLVHYVGGPAPSALFLMISAAATGLGLALVFEWRGLAASIGAHMAFNVIGLVLIFSGA